MLNERPGEKPRRGQLDSLIPGGYPLGPGSPELSLLPQTICSQWGGEHRTCHDLGGIFWPHDNSDLQSTEPAQVKV